MPRRTVTFGTDEVYHVFNRSLSHYPIFTRETDACIFLDLLHYYKQTMPPIKFSFFRKQGKQMPNTYEDCLISLISFCLMPNHFHLCLRQEKDQGVRLYMQRVTNSFSHYFQKKYERRGPLCESAFKAVHIKTNEQLLHLTRYQHLNPVTAHLVDHPGTYPYSSYRMYMGKQRSIVDSTIVLGQFSSAELYEKFVLDRIAYQQELGLIKHLLLSDPGSV